MIKKKHIHEPHKRASQRQLRVGEELRHVLSEILIRGSLNDPQLTEVSITISEVRVSPDLANATVYVTYFGPGENAEKLVKALEKASPFLRGLVAQKIYLRRVPNLIFKYDDSFDYATRINSLLAATETDEVREKKVEKPPPEEQTNG